MRIGIDLRLPAAAPGGISRYAVCLVEALARCDADNEYILVQNPWDTLDHIPAGAQNFGRENVGTYCHQEGERRLLGRELERFRLDVFHSPDFIPPEGGARRRVITIHDLAFLHAPERLANDARRYYVDQIHAAVADAGRILADSDAVALDIARRLDVSPRRIVVAHLAAREVFFTRPRMEDLDAVRTRFSLPAEFLLFVGTLEPRKNIPFLLQAHGIMSCSMPNPPPLVLAGMRGWVLEELEAALRGPTGDVRTLGHVDEDSLHALYALATAFVLPSHYEGFGLPVLEAMAAGCPAVVSCHGALPEVAGAAGIVLDTRDPAVWAAAMTRLARDAMFRAERAGASRTRARQFSWRATARLTLDAYTAALSDDGPGCTRGAQHAG